MKTSKYIWTLCLSLLALTFTACGDDDDKGSQSAPMTISQVYLENINDTENKDRPVDFARLGQLIRIEGSGFLGLKKILINGYDTYFNNALMTDNNVWVTLNSNTPVEKAEADVRNKIILVKDQARLEYDFTIRAASPSITSCDNTLPMPGETVTVYGSSLQETTKITLPGGVEITSGIVSDAEGKWFSFTMPGGVTASGSITSEGANGIAKSPTFFNNFDCFVTNFDDKGELGSWNATYSSDDLVDDPLNTGRGKVAMLVPNVKLEAGGLDAGSNALFYATAGNDNANDDWTSRMYNAIPANTPASDVAIQFDIYCPEEWDLSGMIEISLQNNLSNYGYGSGCTKFSTQYKNTATVWVPWLNESDGSHTPFTTGERWQTVTIPMTAVGNYDPNEAPDANFQLICEDRNAGSYRNFLIFFCNSDVESAEDASPAFSYKAKLFTQKIYIDNIRVVSIAPIAVSDF
ncbi:MAG: hypothetical protein IJ604_14085 [Prevotella sp.]|nr:hypothetical protein [Prevotella sp.]MBR1464490.1 hypothetical protein [Prevotella sp.]